MHVIAMDETSIVMYAIGYRMLMMERSVLVTSVVGEPILLLEDQTNLLRYGIVM